MRRAIWNAACRYVRPQPSVVDLGCSRGEALAPFMERFGARNRYVGVDVGPPMLEAARERFKGCLFCAAAAAGFREAGCFLRFLNFAGWVAVKE